MLAPLGRRSAIKLIILIGLLFVVRPTEAFSVHRGKQISTRLSVVAEKEPASADSQSEKGKTFFIRRCLPAEIRQASDILTDVFFREKTNFITYQWERITTYLSLESSYPKPGERHALFVACHYKTGRVLGLAEIDDAPAKDRYATPRPYMFNVAVDPKWRRKGIARDLVLACEGAAREWNKSEVYLKVRDTSKPAIAMYESLGYVIRTSRVEKLNNQYQSLIIMSKIVRK